MHRQPWCVLSVYLAYVCAFLSIWIVVSFTVERFIIVVFPLQGRNFLRIRQAVGVVVGLVLFSLLFYSYALFTSRIINVVGLKQCSTETKFMDFLFIMMYIDTVLTLIVPSVTIIVLNTLIGGFIYKASEDFNSESPLRFQKGDSHFSHTSNTAATVFTELSSKEDSSGERAAMLHLHDTPLRSSAQVKICTVPPARDKKKSAQQRHIKSTKMLLIISSVFLLMNLPTHVVRIRQLVLQMKQSYKPTANDEAFRDFAYLVYYTNFAINFFLYSLCGENFRRCVKKYLLMWKNKVFGFCCCKKHATNIEEEAAIPLREFVNLRK